jgi:hypothetical protein
MASKEAGKRSPLPPSPPKPDKKKVDPKQGSGGKVHDGMLFCCLGKLCSRVSMSKKISSLMQMRLPWSRRCVAGSERLLRILRRREIKPRDMEEGGGGNGGTHHGLVA